MKTPMNGLRVVLVAGAMLACWPAFAGGEKAGAAGMRIYRDPVTGQWLEQPKPEDDGATPQGARLQMPERDYSQVTTELLPDGSLVLKSNGQLRMASGVRRKPDGTFEEVCLPAGSGERRRDADPRQ